MARSRTRKLADQYAIVKLHGEGKPYSEIAEELGISTSEVSSTLRGVHEDWRQRSLDEHEAWVREELERLEKVEEAAWQSFAVTGRDTALNRVLAAINTRARLLGLNMPDKVANTDPSGQEAAPTVQVVLPHNNRDAAPMNMIEDTDDGGA
jgi:hypothetical protein